MIVAGRKISEIASEFGLTKQAIYNRFDRQTIKQMRAQAAMNDPTADTGSTRH